MTDSTSLIEFSEATPNTTNVYPITDLTLPNRSIYIITTAAMPWMTGTAVNPLLRALYLCAMVHPSSRVTLVIPWLFRSQDRLKLYSPLEFLSKEEQEDWIRHEFCVKHCQDIMESTDKLHIQFYNAIYKEAFGSIFSIENIPSSLELLTKKNTCNVAILEEPEHLNWIRVSYPTWKHFFRYVIGIVHTNYPAYAANAAPYVQWISEHTMTALCAHVVRANCHLVLSLSGVIPQYMKTQDQQLTCNVHGVRQEFFQNTHDNNTNNNNNNNNNNETPIYYIGKLLWAKGFDLLLAIQDEYYRHTGGHYFSIDIYGGGSDSREIQLAFLGTKDKGSHPNEQPQPPQQEKSILNDKSTPFTIWNQPSSLRQYILEHQVVPYTFFDSSSSSSDNANTPYAPWTALPDAAKGTLHTSVESTMAIYHLTNRVVQHVLVHHPSTITTIQQDRPLPLPAKFLGVKNHVLLKSMHYKIFLNPSISEVLCTTTAEALAMGKFVIIPFHISNEFFYPFRNCLTYTTFQECVEKIQYALSKDPQPLSEEEAYQFTWMAASHRLIDSCKMVPTLSSSSSPTFNNTTNSDDHGMASWLHVEMSNQLCRILDIQE